MRRCEYCKKTQTHWKELSFHKFPEDESMKQQWVRNMGRSKWVPQKNSMLCSQHFLKNCIVNSNKRTRLRKGSIPTIFRHNKENKTSLSSCNGPSNYDPSNCDYPYVLEQKLLLNKKDLNFEPEIPNPRQSIEDHSTDQVTENVTNIDAISHDHVYDDSPDTIKRKLNAARIRIKNLAAEKRALFLKVVRSRRIVNSLQQTIKQLRSSKQLCDNALCNMQELEDIPLDLLNRVKKIIKQQTNSKIKNPPPFIVLTLSGRERASTHGKLKKKIENKSKQI